MLIGYARCSTTEQRIDLQMDALQLAGCQKIFDDVGVSGSAASRPGLDQALDHLREGDVLVVWRLDRLARSTRNFLDLIDELNGRGVAFRSITESFDTSGPLGKLMVTLIAALGEMERGLIIERTRAGLEAARARGRVGGRKRSLTTKQDRAVRVLYDARQVAVSEIAATFGVSEPTIWRSLSRTKPAESVAI